MNEERDADYWFGQPGAPFAKLETEDEGTADRLL